MRQSTDRSTWPVRKCLYCWNPLDKKKYRHISVYKRARFCSHEHYLDYRSGRNPSIRDDEDRADRDILEYAEQCRRFMRRVDAEVFRRNVHLTEDFVKGKIKVPSAVIAGGKR